MLQKHKEATAGLSTTTQGAWCTEPQAQAWNGATGRHTWWYVGSQKREQEMAGYEARPQKSAVLRHLDSTLLACLLGWPGKNCPRRLLKLPSKFFASLQKRGFGKSHFKKPSGGTFDQANLETAWK